MKKIFTLLFAFVASAGIIFADGYYDEAINIDGYYYLLNEGVSNYRPATATLVGDTAYLQSGSGTNSYCTTAVEIPASVNYNGKDYSVTNIDEVVFEGCHDLTTVTIPNSITSIGDYAFANCWSLASVNIPENVTRIGGSAFSGCGDLTTISIPNSVVDFGIGILAYSGVTHPVYNSHTFVFLPVSYETYVIPDGIETIAGAAFLMCSLKSVTIPNSVTYIGREAFEMCGQLSSVEIPNSVTSIESGAFLECTGLTSITCDAITPPTCGTEVFSGVDKSIPIYVPKESIEAYKAAEGWKDFSNIQAIKCTVASGTCGDNLTWELSCDSVLTISGTGAMTDFQNNTYTPWYGYSSLIQSVVIRDSVTTIGNYAFAFCGNLTTVSLGDSLTAIGEYAFYSCTLLGSITIPDKVKTIGNHAFGYGDRLISVEIGKSVTSIGDYAFYRCIQLPSITIPASVKTIGKQGFANCEALSAVTNYAESPQAVDAELFTAVDLAKCTLYVPEKSIDAYRADEVWGTFGKIQAIKCIIASGTCGAQGNNLAWELSCDSVLVISGTGEMEDYVFDSPCPWYYLKSLIIEDGVTSIGNYAFRWCFELTSVSIPQSVTRIGEWAFLNCNKLTSISIPESVTNIEYGAFADSGLPEVTISNSAISIGIAAFSSSYLTEIKVESDNPNYCAVDGILFDKNTTTLIQCPGGRQGAYTIPKSVTSIGKYAFSGCSGMTSVTIGENVTSIQDGAFEYCSALTSIEIPNSVTSIGCFVFQHCSGLESVTFGNAIISIGKQTFDSCNSLKSITCVVTTPPICGISVFNGMDMAICTLYVPAGSIEAYQKADVWKEFGNIQPIQAEEVPVTEIVAEPTDNSVVIEWPKVDEATVYTIEIRKNGILICTLTFNGQGQLQGITFAKPSRNGGQNAQVRTATQTTTGWQYTINGLEANTEYTYNVVAKKNAGDTETLYNETITFTTKNTPTGIESLQNSEVSNKKVIRNGQLYILRDGEIYNTQGARVK